MSMNIEAEIRDLKRRVSELEGSFGFLSQQVKSVHKDLLTFQAKTEEFQTKTEEKLKEHDGRFDLVDHQLRGLRNDLPKIVGDAVREANGGRPRRKS